MDAEQRSDCPLRARRHIGHWNRDAGEETTADLQSTFSTLQGRAQQAHGMAITYAGEGTGSTGLGESVVAFVLQTLVSMAPLVPRAGMSISDRCLSRVRSQSVFGTDMLLSCYLTQTLAR